MWRFLVCSALALCGVSATQPKTPCSIECPTIAWQGHKVTPGAKTRWKYEALSVTIMPGATVHAETGGLQIQLDVVGTVPTATCWAAINLENVQVLEIVDSNYTLSDKLTTQYSTALTKYSIWTRASHGLMDCLWWHEEEPLWVRNFKRGILSMFQNDLIKTDYWETSVTGTCRVKQTFTGKSPTDIFIHKVYDRSSCFDQPKRIMSSIPFSPEQNPIGSQFYDVPTTSWRHVQAIDGLGMVWKTIMTESKHTFTPFGPSGGDPTLLLRQNLYFVSFDVTANLPEPPFNKCDCSSILFEFPEPDVHIPDECDSFLQPQIETKIDFLASNFKQPEKIKYSKEFLQLVQLLRKACPKQLKELWVIYKEAEDRTVQREIFLDALPVVCTDASVRVLTDEVMPGDGLSIRRSHIILKDMHFCNYTTKPMIRHYLKFLTTTNEIACPNCTDSLTHELQDLKVERWLLLGSLIQQVDCHRTIAAGSLTFLNEKLFSLLSQWQELQRRVQGNSSSEIQDLMMQMKCFKRDIIALIGTLGNAGCYDSIDTLSELFNDKMLPVEIRTAAIQATRLMINLASHKLFDLMKSIFMDRTNPTEVRIAAWDIMMEVGSSKFPLSWLDFVITVASLSQETDSNVGSYALSWLTSCAEYPDIDEKKASLCQYLLQQTGAFMWGNRFNLGYHSSKFDVISWSPLSLGEVKVLAKTRVVYNGDSTMPLSASVELDVYLFGQRISLFKLEGHTKGATWILENLFGPVGYFSTNKTYSFQCGLKHVIQMLTKPFPEKDFDIIIHFSMLGREFRHWARNRCWFEEYMRSSPFYNITNTLWWVFHDTGYDMDEYCPWTIESPVWHKKTGLTWENAIDVFQRVREMLTVWKSFYDGTIWDRTFNMNATSVLTETNIMIPSIVGLPIIIAGSITGHVNIESSGTVRHPVSASSSLWPQAVWNHLWKIWNIWTKPVTVEWHAEVNPRINLESTFSVGFDAHFAGSSVQVEIDVQSNQKFEFQGTLEPSDYTFSYKIPSDSRVSNLVSYNSLLSIKSWNTDSSMVRPIISDIPLEKKIFCTPKDLIGAELCVQYQFYTSTNTGSPFYPLNGPSSANILLSTADKPCDNCGYKMDRCCSYSLPPTKITSHVLKTDTDNFVVYFEGTGSSPERKVRVDYRRDRDYPTDVMFADLSWDTCQGSPFLTPNIKTRLAFRWDRIDLQGSITGKSSTWEIDSFSWMNRTVFESNTTFYVYDKLEMCEWKRPEDPHKILIEGSIVKRKEGHVRVEVEDQCHVKHWWHANYTINQLMTNITMNSSLFREQKWNFGLPLPHPVDTASCYIFGRNFITFDNLHYAVDAHGSYYLVYSTSDNFTVILHHSGLSKTPELEIWMASTKYYLTAEGLSVNNTQENITYKSCVVNVTRWHTDSGESYVRLTSQIGLEIYYRPEAMEVSVNGFYYRHLKGLCGNYNNNNQRIDEWQMSDNNVARTVTQFVDSWRIDGPGGPGSKMLKNIDYSLTTRHTCNSTFQTYKTVSREIDLDSFYKACLAEVENIDSLRTLPRSLQDGVCRAVGGVKVASFSRDLTLPSVCWYSIWSDWMVDDQNDKVKFRERKLIHGCDDLCEPTQIEYKITDEIEVYECKPWTSQQVITTLGKSKKCLSEENFPVCPTECQSFVGPIQQTNFKCSSSFELLNEAPITILGYQPVKKCICSVPCWKTQESSTCG